MYGCEVWSSDNNLHKVNIAGITAVDESLRAVGERVPDLFCSFIKHSQYLSYWISVSQYFGTDNQKSSNNPILYALSRLHQNRFIATGCKYGIDLLSNS